MNVIAVTGFITTDISLDVTPNSGKYVAKFGMAITSPYNKKKSSFVDIEVWGSKAERIAEYCQKGSKVGITGHLEVAQWNDNAGKVRKRPFIVASATDYLSTKKDSNEDKISMNELNSYKDISDDDLPF